MEFSKETKDWLSTIPVRRQEGFKRYVKKALFLLFDNNFTEEKVSQIINEKKEQIIKYMNEENDKNRKHGSKGKRHKERGNFYVKGIENRFNKYGVDYVRLFKEIYNVDLKEKADGYLGLCPIHNEKTPSLSINVTKGVVKCYGCGNGGSNIVHFMRNTINKNISEVYGIIEKYVFSKDESEEFYEYWKRKIGSCRERNPYVVDVEEQNLKTGGLLKLDDFEGVQDDLPF